MFMTPVSCKLVRGLAIGYEYKPNTVTINILEDATSKDLHTLGWEINHEIFNIPQWLPPNVKIDIKLPLASSNFIL